MTLQEFSNSFDVLVNSFSRELSFGEEATTELSFNEYEKSVFLTKAQEQLIVSLYNGNNSKGDSFESSEELRRYLEPLVVGKIVDPVDTTAIDEQDTTPVRTTRDTYMVPLEEDVWFIIFESVNLKLPKTCLPDIDVQVQPITHDEYHRIKNNPFRGPNEHRVLRLDANLYRDNLQYVELISKYPITHYLYRYIKKPYPIILTDLTNEGLSINGESVPKEVNLLMVHESLHGRILELAVKLALQSKGRGLSSNN